ncbi:hypothetical protein HK097_001717 [Rhizophlyctis rosea]|uniref:Uncharacterized protein n=1 Tax=Rhizophlyctis rosea TaxID=64517 RepID=A0AAD5X155_9FUNG|nr:hypothetical protein HK097_001717 [Rhizophlyctis rosea]
MTIPEPTTTNPSNPNTPFPPTSQPFSPTKLTPAKSSSSSSSLSPFPSSLPLPNFDLGTTIDFQKDATYDPNSPFAHPTNDGGTSTASLTPFQKRALLALGAAGQRKPMTKGDHATDAKKMVLQTPNSPASTYSKYGGSLLTYAEERRKEFVKAQAGKKEKVDGDEEMEIDGKEVEEEGRNRKVPKRVDEVGEKVGEVMDGGEAEKRGMEEW